MSENKGLIQMLAQCEKSEFDDVVKSYLKAIYKTKTLVVTDGKNDGGLDVKVMDMPLKKLQFQMTIQKSSTANERRNLEAKILADVAKAQKNVENYAQFKQKQRKVKMREMNYKWLRMSNIS
jgi:2,3-bisphosphoglycerate-independent phosphoglycerate mutase